MTIRLAPASQEHRSALSSMDQQVADEELGRLIEGGRVIVALEGEELIGTLRWGLLWDKVPFMTLLHRDGVPPGRRRGHPPDPGVAAGSTTGGV